MCEIQLIKRFDNKTLLKNDIETFKNFMMLGYSTNSDAYGIFNQRGTILKGNDVLTNDKMEFLEGEKHKFLVGHNRYKTTGCNKVMDNNHPFETENFIIVHNGMIGNHAYLKEHFELDYKVETDSYIIIALLEKFYKENNNLKEAFDKGLSPLSGSFSVVIYFKPEKRLFYVKNGSPSFTFRLVETDTGDLLIGSTDERNFDYTFNEVKRGVFNKLDLEYLEFIPKADVVYELEHKTIVKFIEYESKPLFKPYKSEVKKDIFSSSPITSNKDFLKKQMFKQIARKVIEMLPREIEVLTRAYQFDNRNTIILYINKPITLDTLEYLQDHFLEYASIIYEPTIDMTKGKLIIEVDVKDAEHYYGETTMSQEQVLEKEYDTYCRVGREGMYYDY
jgi:glucosamine 6-phosphate synthetase-like amidotransferase/phosphosugar isomerase protein